jgi:hypothetical protein
MYAHPIQTSPLQAAIAALRELEFSRRLLDVYRASGRPA